MFGMVFNFYHIDLLQGIDFLHQFFIPELQHILNQILPGILYAVYFQEIHSFIPPFPADADSPYVGQSIGTSELYGNKLVMAGGHNGILYIDYLGDVLFDILFECHIMVTNPDFGHIRILESVKRFYQLFLFLLRDVLHAISVKLFSLVGLAVNPDTLDERPQLGPVIRVADMGTELSPVNLFIIYSKTGVDNSLLYIENLVDGHLAVTVEVQGNHQSASSISCSWSAL
jgi:hypothetical protein